MSKQKTSVIVKNKNASRNYVLGEIFQAGMVLEGGVVKSLRDGKIDVKNSYVTFKKDEAWLFGIKIDPPASLQDFNVDPVRTRKLLLKKREISELQKLKNETPDWLLAHKNHTLIAPYATSLRLSPIGYVNSRRCRFKVNYQDLNH